MNEMTQNLTEQQKEIAINVMRDLGYTGGWDEGCQLIAAFLAAHTTRYQQDYKAQRDELISIMKQIKSNLMHHRRFGDDTFRAWKNAAARAEGDLEEALDSLKGYE